MEPVHPTKLPPGRLPVANVVPWRCLPLLVVALWTVGILPHLCAQSMETEKLLRDALRKDATLGDVSTRMGDLTDRQSLSSVYQTSEIAATESVQSGIQKGRDTAMKEVLDTLRSGIGVADAAVLSSVHANTRVHYQELLEILRGIRRQRAAQIDRRQQLRNLLEEQEALLEDTRTVEKQQSQDRPQPAARLEQFADLASRQADLAQRAEEGQVQKDMKAAEDALGDMQPAPAVQHQQAAVTELRKQLAQTLAPEDATEADANAAALQAEAQRIEQMQNLDRRLEQLERKLRETARRKESPPPSFQQETALELDGAARDLRKLQVEPAAKEVVAAIPETMAERWVPAADHVKNARDQLQAALAAAMEALRQAAEQAKPQPPEQAKTNQPNVDVAPTGESPRQHSANADSRTPPPLSGWEARLPAHERDALLAARAARYDGKWEDEVQRYFLELAR